MGKATMELEFCIDFMWSGSVLASGGIIEFDFTWKKEKANCTMNTVGLVIRINNKSSGGWKFELLSSV